MDFQQHQEFLNAVRKLADKASNDPRNEDDFDTWTYGTEPLPYDHTWHSKQLDVSPGNADVTERST